MDKHIQGMWLDAAQIHSLLRQEQIWIDKDLKTHRIEDMSSRYLRNLAGFLARHYIRMRVFVNQSLKTALEDPPLGYEKSQNEPLPFGVQDTVLFAGIMRELDERDSARPVD